MFEITVHLYNLNRIEMSQMQSFNAGWEVHSVRPQPETNFAADLSAKTINCSASVSEKIQILKN